MISISKSQNPHQDYSDVPGGRRILHIPSTQTRCTGIEGTVAASTSRELLIAFFRNSSFPFTIFTSETNILFAKFCSFLVDLASHLFQEPLSDGRGSSESGWLQAFSLPMSLPHLTQCRAENTRLTLCCI